MRGRGRGMSGVMRLHGKHAGRRTELGRRACKCMGMGMHAHCHRHKHTHSFPRPAHAPPTACMHACMRAGMQAHSPAPPHSASPRHPPHGACAQVGGAEALPTCTLRGLLGAPPPAAPPCALVPRGQTRTHCTAGCCPCRRACCCTMLPPLAKKEWEGVCLCNYSVGRCKLPPLPAGARTEELPLPGCRCNSRPVSGATPLPGLSAPPLPHTAPLKLLPRCCMCSGAVEQPAIRYTKQIEVTTNQGALVRSPMRSYAYIILNMLQPMIASSTAATTACSRSRVAPQVERRAQCTAA